MANEAILNHDMDPALRRRRSPACYDFGATRSTCFPEFMRVGLFTTCLVDRMRHSIAFAAIRLRENAGYEVTVPAAQTCCGQPGWNSGDRESARSLAEKLIVEFEDCRYVVVPSGSCAGMIRAHFPEVFADEPAMLAKARELAGRTYELTEFLTKIAKRGVGAASLDGTVANLDAWLGRRETGVEGPAPTVLSAAAGAEACELLVEVCRRHGVRDE